MSRANPSIWAKLLRQPGRFRFDAALRVLMHAARAADPAEAARFRSQPGLAFPPAEVLAAEPQPGRPPRLVVALMGLIGAAGVLPPLYAEEVAASVRGRSSSLHDFLDQLSHRMVAFFGRAGIKYRLHRMAETAALATPPARDPVAGALLALTGHGTAGLTGRIAAGEEPLLHYAGLFAMHPRSAERLAALVSDWLGRRVEAEQFAGGWLALAPAQCTALPRGTSPGNWNRLGVDAALGMRAWDVHSRVVLRIGPLDRAAFEAVLPDQPGHARLVSLARAFLGFETAFAINPVLAGSAMFPLRLGAGERPRLGWNTWLAPQDRPRLTDAADPLFEAEAS